MSETSEILAAPAHYRTVVTDGGGHMQTPRPSYDDPPHQKTLNIWIKNLDPKNLDCWIAWGENPAVGDYSQNKPNGPLDFDIWDADPRLLAVRIVIKISDGGAKFLDKGRAIQVPPGRPSYFIYALEEPTATDGYRSIAFKCRLDHVNPRKRRLQFNMGVQIPGAQYVIDMFYDPKIKNNGEICPDDDPAPECN